MTSHIENILRYRRLEHDGVPLYIYPEYPDWFIPTGRTDEMLKILLQGGPLTDAARADSKKYNTDVTASLLLIDNFLGRFYGSDTAPYTGRFERLRLDRLKECWLHITNRCNLCCAHCMFSSCPSDSTELALKDAVAAIHQAADLGCRVFYFTGGEPFMHADITSAVDEALAVSDAHAVVLTNACALQRFSDWLSRADTERLHFQISLDGTPPQHDRIRGTGTFEKVCSSLKMLRQRDFNCTLAMSVMNTNHQDMQRLVETAYTHGVHNVHYLWLFPGGKADTQTVPDAEVLAGELFKAYREADRYNVLIDNIEAVQSQVFCLPGTHFDLSNAGWQSLSIGPDGGIYPTPALTGEKRMLAGHISQGLEAVWKNSPVLDQVRRASIARDERYSDNPLRFFIGGGDIDHSFIHGGSLTGHDPYAEVYNRTALHLLAREAGKYVPRHSRMGFVCRMGERLHLCSDDMGESSFTHSNCVLSLPGRDGHTLVKAFYSAAAEDTNEDILNPVSYDEQLIAHIPARSRVRSYGCGSPVMDCALQPGETLVDLGSGAGVECFIAAKQAGPAGRVIGIDMADSMLELARKSKPAVAQNLGYDTVDFRKGILEDLPIDSGIADVVISNCVINLSPDKRTTFLEIFRILKPGGRIMISDIAYDEEIPLSIKYNEKLRGECIGGAFRERELFGMLDDCGFESSRVEKRFLYREIKGHRFYSVTYAARKPSSPAATRLLYRGPFAAVITDDGSVLTRGAVTPLSHAENAVFDDSVFIIDESGHVKNVRQECSCACFVPPPEQKAQAAAHVVHTSGCMVCGAEILYAGEPVTRRCHYCGAETPSPAVCKNGHFVCDTCHARDAVAHIKRVCLGSGQQDMLLLLKQIREYPFFPLHGPEHHALVPGVILAAYRNSGGDLSDATMVKGIEMGRAVPGGCCAFWGACGAALGAGIAFSVILEASPLKARERRIVQRVTAEILGDIARFTAPRCCQRECAVALQKSATLSRKYLSVTLTADAQLTCAQHEKNRECIGKACPLWQ